MHCAIMFISSGSSALENTNQSLVGAKIKLILPQSGFIHLLDCLSTFEATLCCRTEKRLAKEGGREGNVRAAELGDEVLCWFSECAASVRNRGEVKTLKCARLR